MKKKDAYDFFSAAIKKAPDVNHVITGYHRLIVSKMKRFHDSKNLRQLMDQMVSIEIPKSAERKLYFALFENLLGLGMVMEEAPLSWISAKTSLLVAADYISEFLQESTNIDLISQARRYQGQVGINMVQLEVSNNDLDQALFVATENLDNVKKYSTDYVAEAYNTLGYTEYLCKNYEDAIVHLKTAVDEQSKIGNLDGIIDARRILISCYVKLKDNKKAETEARLIIEKSFEFED
ncbi:hypothetical protein [Furfurilactobacillus entadae]|uniref:hypothetical protein n=1 Tax=Furfurilactobacillus entadae TaxID=2922307 RepID=UPI0038B29805